MIRFQLWEGLLGEVLLSSIPTQYLSLSYAIKMLLLAYNHILNLLCLGPVRCTTKFSKELGISTFVKMVTAHFTIPVPLVENFGFMVLPVDIQIWLFFSSDDLIGMHYLYCIFFYAYFHDTEVLSLFYCTYWITGYFHRAWLDSLQGTGIVVDQMCWWWVLLAIVSVSYQM